jgi:hypothetical protein
LEKRRSKIMSLWLIVLVVVFVILLFCAPDIAVVFALIVLVVFLIQQKTSPVSTEVSSQEKQIICIFQDLSSPEEDLQIQVTLPVHWSLQQEEIIEIETLSAPASFISDTAFIDLQGIGPVSVSVSALELPLQSTSTVTQTANFRSDTSSGLLGSLQIYIAIPKYADIFAFDIPVEAIED